MLKIGTRQSPLALIQVDFFIKKLTSQFYNLPYEVIKIVTTGDIIKDKPLHDIGGKELFVKEIHQQMLEGQINCGVHSLKDLPSFLHPHIDIAAVLPRGSVEDVFLSFNYPDLMSLPECSRLGTSAPRRTLQCSRLRPDLEILPIRGNVETRLQKLKDGEYDAIILAKAGLERLKLSAPYMTVLDKTHVIPAAGQGIIAIDCLTDDKDVRDKLKEVNHASTYLSALTERAVLQKVNGDCFTPIAAHATLQESLLTLNAWLSKPDQTESRAKGQIDLLHPLEEFMAENIQKCLELGFKIGENLLR